MSKLIICEICDMEFTFDSINESFGTTPENDNNIIQINCPNATCRRPIIIKSYLPLK